MTGNTPLNADDELRKDIEHLILAWSSETTGEPRERLAPDALTLVDRFSNFILADRKKHELQARIDELNRIAVAVEDRRTADSFDGRVYVTKLSLIDERIEALQKGDKDD